MDTICAGLRQQHPDSNSHANLRVRPLRDAIVGEAHTALMTLSAMASCVLLVACVNVANLLLARPVSRQKEIGIRLALGAQRSHVLGLIFGEGLRLVAVGAIVGVAVVFVVARFLNSLLYGIGATDPLTIISVTALLSAVAFLACWWPARRASIVDPIIALRNE